MIVMSSQYVLLGKAKDEETQIVGAACLKRPDRPVLQMPPRQGIPHAWDAATKAKGRKRCKGCGSQM